MEPFGPIYPAGAGCSPGPHPPSPHQPTTLPSVHPPTGGAGPGRPPGYCREGTGEGGGPADGFGSSWLTCLVTPGNGCLGEVLDFLVLLQKALQKLGRFLNRNSKASSKPLLPCVSRSTIRGQPLTQRVPGTQATRQGPPHVEVSPQKGSWKTWCVKAQLAPLVSSDWSGWRWLWLYTPSAQCRPVWTGAC